MREALPPELDSVAHLHFWHFFAHSGDSESDEPDSEADNPDSGKNDDLAASKRLKALIKYTSHFI